MTDLKSLFLLDPAVHFLNHGSFGATPRPIFDVYQEWQRRLEWQPVQFIGRDILDYLATARQALGDYLLTAAEDLVFVPNATFGLNVVARSLALGPGDEVLTTDHEYGACNNVWRFLSEKRGFAYVQQALPLPVLDDEAMIARLWEGVTPATRVIYLSHITSSTAMRLPVTAICSRARAEGILTVIDGAHAPGQIPLNLRQIGADFYFGNAHKWLCAPKGAAFLFARRDQQRLIAPLVVGWGWGPERELSAGSDFLDYLQWLGTDDLSAYLSVPAAITFQEKHDWTAVQERCHQLLVAALAQIADLTECPSPYAHTGQFRQMAIAPLPPITDLALFKRRLYDEFQVEIPCIEWQEQQFIRISMQAYNNQEDVTALLHALQSLLPL